VCDVDDAWFHESRRVEHFACYIPSRSNDYEPAVTVSNINVFSGYQLYVLVEHRDTTQRTDLPLLVVIFKLGVNRLHESTDEG